MAITINTSPNALSSVFQPILFNVSSNNAAPELKIHCKVECFLDAAWKTVNTQVIDKNNTGTFDCYIQQAVNAALAVFLPLGNHNTQVADEQSLVSFRVRFAELIHDANKLFIEAATLQSASFKAANIIFQAIETGSPDDFTIKTSGVGKFLRDGTNQIKVKPNQPLILSFIYDEASVTPTPQLTVLS